MTNRSRIPKIRRNFSLDRWLHDQMEELVAAMPHTYDSVSDLVRQSVEERLARHGIMRPMPGFHPPVPLHRSVEEPRRPHLKVARRSEDESGKPPRRR